MTDDTVKKVDASAAPTGELGQEYLVSGTRVALRRWKQQQPGGDITPHTRDYETVGYVIQGRVRVHLGADHVELGPGESWLVPAGAEHAYEILEPLTAVEATAPPARVDDRDAPPSS